METIPWEINMGYGLNDLYCISVDDPNYSENNWINDNGFYIDNHIGFSELILMFVMDFMLLHRQVV